MASACFKPTVLKRESASFVDDQRNIRPQHHKTYLVESLTALLTKGEVVVKAEAEARARRAIVSFMVDGRRKKLCDIIVSLLSAHEHADKSQKILKSNRKYVTCQLYVWFPRIHASKHYFRASSFSRPMKTRYVFVSSKGPRKIKRTPRKVENSIHSRSSVNAK